MFSKERRGGFFGERMPREGLGSLVYLGCVSLFLERRRVVALRAMF